jgi:NDP-sugar pyrophosphorylase family protein
VRAIVIATGQSNRNALLDERHPVPMLPLVDRPFIQHVVEYLEDQGMRVFDFVLHHLPEQCERLLGDGTRWNSTFTFHLASDANRPYKLLKIICSTCEEDEPILVLHADRLPAVKLTPNAATQQQCSPQLFCWSPPDAASTVNSLQWTGWAWVPRVVLSRLPDDLEENTLTTHLRALATHHDAIVEVPHLLSAQTYDDILAAHHTVLSNTFSGLLLTGREIEHGIWLARNVSLHPTARLVPPVYIGENCRIGKGVQLGPGAVVGNDCVLDKHCSVVHSSVFPGSYVGEGLELRESIVDKNRLVNVRVGAAVEITDDFILGSLTENHVRRALGGFVSRGLALLLLGMTWPVLCALALYLKLTRPGPVLYKQTVVRLPAATTPSTWRTFALWRFVAKDHLDPAAFDGVRGGIRHLLLHLLPALVNIAKGELRFVGVAPRAPEEILALPHDWRALYLRAKAGVITEAHVRYGAAPSKDELYTAEAFYAVMASLRYDIQLCLAYWTRLVRGAPVEHEPKKTPPYGEKCRPSLAAEHEENCRDSAEAAYPD